MKDLQIMERRKNKNKVTKLYPKIKSEQGYKVVTYNEKQAGLQSCNLK